MTARPLSLALGLAAAWAFALAANAAAETPPGNAGKCAERFAELLKDYPAPALTAYKLDGHNHDADAKGKDANFRFQGWLFVGRKTAVEQLVFKKASAALRSKTSFAADARNCFTPEFGLRLNNGEQELHLLVGLRCQAVEFHAGRATARYPLSDLGANAFRALFDELFAEKPDEKKEEKEDADKAEAKKKLSRNVSFEFKDVPVGEALKLLGSLINASVVVDPGIAEAVKKKSFSLKVTDLPLDRALDHFCYKTDLAWDMDERHIFIAEPPVIGARKATRLLVGFDDAPLVACKVVAEEAPNEADTPEATHLARWKILVARDVLEGMTVEEVRTALTSAASYKDMGAKCFDPGMGFRLKKDGQRLDIVICLECSWAYFFLDDQRLHLALSEKGKEKVKALYEKLFPAEDPPKKP
ncbi:MAG: hypothetical protein L6R28_23810 [Planctomycetes bacterium]|nr:hypothetical protein [Planctomycetota bacterium]